MRIALTLAVLLAATVFHAFLFPVDADATIAGNDAVSYALALESGDPARIVDAHHPLFHALALGVYGLLETLFPNTPLNSSRALHLTSALGGGALLAILYAFAARGSRRLAVGLVLFAGTSMGILTYSSVGESYTPAIAAWTCALAIALERVMERRSLPVLGLAAISILALLLRQDSVLVVPAIALAYLWPETNARPLRDRAWRAFGYVALTGTATLLLYLLAYLVHRLGQDPNPSPVSWLLHLAESGKWGRFGDLPPAYALRVACETTAGSWDYGLFWNSSISVAKDPGVPGVLPSLPAWLAWSIFLVPFASSIALGLSTASRATLIVLVLVATRLVFFAWWQPANAEYQFGNLVPFLALAAVWIGVRVPQPTTKRANALTNAVLVALLAWATFQAARLETLLLQSLREREWSERSARIERWQRAGARILVLDDYAHWALQRFGDVPHERYLPSDESSRGPSLEREIVERLASGGTTIFTTDTVLPAALGLDRWLGSDKEYWGIDHLTRLLERLGPELAKVPVRSIGARPEWAIVLGELPEE